MTSKDQIQLQEEPFIIMEALSKSCDLIRQWAEKFSTLCRISNADRDRLLFSNLLDLVVIRLALRFDFSFILYLVPSFLLLI